MLFIAWCIISFFTAFFFALIIADCYRKLLNYYNNLGMKIPFNKSSFGAKLTSLIKYVFISICPILHILYLVSFIVAYEEICNKVVLSYIRKYKEDKVNDY